MASLGGRFFCLAPHQLADGFASGEAILPGDVAMGEQADARLVDGARQDPAIL